MNVRPFCMNCMAEKQEQVVCPVCGIDDRTLPESPHVLPYGTTLQNRYLIGRLLGAGGFGNTYLALDTVLHKKIAIKEYMPREFATRSQSQTKVVVLPGESSQYYERGLHSFLHESRTLAKFNNHPGIVSVKDFFHENNTAYIVMEYVEGLTLKQYVQKKGGRIPLEEALLIMTPVMDALREVHAAGVLHRDVSPDNIYITTQRQVKLLDFGAARQALGDVSKSLSVILKPGFAPVEQYSSRGKQGPWTDVYAVAATIYMIVTGSIPLDVMERITEDELVPLNEKVNNIPVYISDAVSKGLALRVADRWQSMVEFQFALQGKAYIEPQASPNASARAARSRKKRFVTIGMIVAVACTFVSGAFMMVQSNDVDFKVGSYIQFGRYYDEPILWRVVSQNADGDPLLLSDRIITFKAFDAGKSNFYEQANLRQWLNSEQIKIEWRQTPPEKSKMYTGANAYDQEAGFLTDRNFTAAERQRIVPYTHKVLLADQQAEQADGGDVAHVVNLNIADVLQNYEQARYKMFTDRVFIFSVQQLKEFVYDQRSILGDNYFLAKPTAAAIANNEFQTKQLSTEQYWYYWLNTPVPSKKSRLRNVYKDGVVFDEALVHGVDTGVRPALVLDRSTEEQVAEGDGSLESPYAVDAQ